MKNFITKQLPHHAEKAMARINSVENVEKATGMIDHAVRLMVQKDFDAGNDIVNAARAPIRFGMWVLFILFGVFGLWSACAPLKSAAVASGSIALDANKKTIQHLEGGIIKDILVKDGDAVKAGQPLLILDETAAKARYDIVVGQLRAARANEIRLVAERNEAETVDFNDPLLTNVNDPEVKTVLDTQTHLFESRRLAVVGQINVLNQKIKQLNEEIIGLQAQEQAAKKQISYLNEEISTVQTLVEKGQALRPRLLALQRSASDITGRQGEYQAQVARARQSIAEAQVQIINVKNEHQTETSKELRDIQATIADYQERMKAAEDVLKRMVIAAPQSGIVTGLVYHTKGGVVQAGAPIMDLIPQDDKLVVEAKVSPMDIDVVHAGLPARVRLSAFKSRRIPTVDGKVVTVSADKFTDKNQNVSYYIARIEIDPQEMKELREADLYPGMPADVLIVTGQHTLLGYLFTPIGDTMFHAFREQ